MKTLIIMHSLSGIGDRLRAVEEKLDLILKKEDHLSKEMDDLTAQVHSNTTVIESAINLIKGIAARIAAAGTDPAALTALTEELASEGQKLADAVAANTPAAPAPTA